jgi:hypothetical protein
MKKKNFLTKKDFDAIQTFLDKNYIQLPAVLVLRLFKIGILSKRLLDFIVQTAEIQTQNQDFDYEDDDMQEEVDDDLQTEISYLRFLDALAMKRDVEIAKFFLRNLLKRDRIKAIETYHMSPIEQYIYFIVKKKIKRGERINNLQILFLVKNFKRYKIKNEKYFFNMLEKIKRKVRRQLNVKNSVA